MLTESGKRWIAIGLLGYIAYQLWKLSIVIERVLVIEEKQSGAAETTKSSAPEPQRVTPFVPKTVGA